MRGLDLGLAAAILIAASPAIAERVPVQSGEHADFSRVVLQFRQPTTWRVEPRADGHAVIFDRDGLEPDLSNVFEKMPPNRITDVRFEPAARSLEFTTNCACPIDVFAVGSRAVAIDIRDEVPAAQSASVSPASEAPPQTEAPSISLVLPRPSFVPPLRLGSRQIASGETPPPAELSQPARVETEAQPNNPAPPQGLNASEAIELSETRRTLLESLARAASSGLVVTQAQSPDDQTVLPRRPSLQPVEPEAPDQLRIDTPFARQAPVLPGERLARCTDANRSFEGLSLPEDPLLALSEARYDLVDDSGRIITANALTLADLYVSLGFGVEALRLLEAVPTTADSTHVSLLKAAARLIDGGDIQDSNPLGGLATCGGKVAIWALASAPPAADELVDADRDIVEAFQSFPETLQLILGPEVIANLFAAGEDDAGFALQRSLDLTRQGAGLLSTDETAGLSAAPGSVADSVPLGAEFESADTALADISFETSRGNVVSEERIEYALGFAEELRETSLGRDLMRAVAEAQMLAGRTESAFKVFDRLTEFRSGEPDAILRTALVQRLVNYPEDAVFLGAVFGRGWVDRPGALTPTSLELLAGRLDRLGFRAQAQALLEELRARDDPGEGQELPSRSSRPIAAIEAPEQETRVASPSLPPADSELLQTEPVQTPPLTETARLLAELQARVRAAEPGPDSEALQLSGLDGPDVSDDAGPLARGADLVRLSEDSRAAIVELLERPVFNQ